MKQKMIRIYPEPWATIAMCISQEDMDHYFKYLSKEDLDNQFNYLFTWLTKFKASGWYYEYWARTVRIHLAEFNDFKSYLKLHQFSFKNEKAYENLWFLMRAMNADAFEIGAKTKNKEFKILVDNLLTQEFNRYKEQKVALEEVAKSGYCFWIDKKTSGRKYELRILCYKRWVTKLRQPFQNFLELKDEKHALILIGLLFNYITDDFKEMYVESSGNKLTKNTNEADQNNFHEFLHKTLKSYKTGHPLTKADSLNDLGKVMLKIKIGEVVTGGDLPKHVLTTINYFGGKSEIVPEEKLRLMVYRYKRHKKYFKELNMWPVNYELKNSNPLTRKFALQLKEERRKKKLLKENGV